MISAFAQRLRLLSLLRVNRFAGDGGVAECDDLVVPNVRQTKIPPPELVYKRLKSE